MLKVIQEEENILWETRELFVEWCIENEALCGTVLFHLSQVYQCTTSMSVKWTTLRYLDIYITNEALGPSLWPNWYFDNATHRVENFNVSVMELLCTHRFVTVNYLGAYNTYWKCKEIILLGKSGGYFGPKINFRNSRVIEWFEWVKIVDFRNRILTWLFFLVLQEENEYLPTSYWAGNLFYLQFLVIYDMLRPTHFSGI